MNEQSLTREIFLDQIEQIQDYLAGAYSAFNHAGDPSLARKRLEVAQIKLDHFIERLKQIPAFKDE